MFARARLGEALTPAERSALKFLKTLAAGLAALLLVNLGPVTTWLHSLGLPPGVADTTVTILTAALMAYDKYNNAIADAGKSTALMQTQSPQPSPYTGLATPTQAPVAVTTPTAPGWNITMAAPSESPLIEAADSSL